MFVFVFVFVFVLGLGLANPNPDPNPQPRVGAGRRAGLPLAQVRTACREQGLTEAGMARQRHGPPCDRRANPNPNPNPTLTMRPMRRGSPELGAARGAPWRGWAPRRAH